ncbi:NUDIX hydrolase [Myxococcota bacterium]
MWLTGRHGASPGRTVVRSVPVDSAGRLLLVRKYGSDRCWEPGYSGWIEPGESAVETAVREGREELGVAVEHVEYVCRYAVPARGLLIACFSCSLSSGDFVLGAELAAAKWVPLGDADSFLPDTQHQALVRLLVRRKMVRRAVRKGPERDESGPRTAQIGPQRTDLWTPRTSSLGHRTNSALGGT